MSGKRREMHYDVTGFPLDGPVPASPPDHFGLPRVPAPAR
jgi:hypothetical protein